MKTITATQGFLDGYDRYEAGESYELDDGRAYYFVMNGWAESDQIETPQQRSAESVTLAVENAAHSTEADSV